MDRNPWDWCKGGVGIHIMTYRRGGTLLCLKARHVQGTLCIPYHNVYKEFYFILYSVSLVTRLDLFLTVIGSI